MENNQSKINSDNMQASNDDSGSAKDSEESQEAAIPIMNDETNMVRDLKEIH